MTAFDYEIVASAENSPYLLWQCCLFVASCCETQAVSPTIVIHGEGPLLAGFRALQQLGVRIVRAPSYRLSDGVEYTCRNTAGSLLEAVTDRPYTLICDPDFLFLKRLPTAAAVLRGSDVSWDHVSYMEVGDDNRRWLSDACAELGVDPTRLDTVRVGGVVPNLVPETVRAELARHWLEAVDTLVRIARRSGEVPWVTIAWAFALAAWKLELDLELTGLTRTNYDGARTLHSPTPILHYCYGDATFDKRRHRSAEAAAALWSAAAANGAQPAGFMARLRAAHDWFRQRDIDVGDPRLYQPSTPLPVTRHIHGGAFQYLDTLPLAEAAVGYGSLGLHGDLGYEDKRATVCGEAFEHAVSSHPPARVLFELGGRFARFRCHVALNDDVLTAGSRADFSVLADGRLVAFKAGVEAGAAWSLEANVWGAQRLELRVETDRFPYCHALWLDPEVMTRGEPSLSILIPTIGRPELARLLGELLPQLQPQDEILVIGDGPQPHARQIAEVDPKVRYLEHGPANCWGHPQRNWAMTEARGTHVLSLDDDDRLAPAALDQVRRAIAEAPGRPLMFREYHEGSIIWREPAIAVGNVSTQMFVVPNVPCRLGRWGGRYQGDFDFVESTVALYPDGADAVVWRPEVIALHGTASWKDAVDTWVWPDPKVQDMLAQMDAIPGWFSPREAMLLFELAPRALQTSPSGTLVEIGSYCGRSTLVLGTAVRTWRPNGELFAIDPHDGELSTPYGTERRGSSLTSFTENMRAAGLERTVSLLRKKSSEVEWQRPIALLFIDGLHDYTSVSTDFSLFAPHVETNGLIAFHDYANADYPAVRRVVDEALASSKFVSVAEVDSLKVLQKLD